MRNPSPKRVGWRRGLVLLADCLRLAASSGLRAALPPESAARFRGPPLLLPLLAALAGTSPRPRFPYGSWAFVPLHEPAQAGPGAPPPRESEGAERERWQDSLRFFHPQALVSRRGLIIPAS